MTGNLMICIIIKKCLLENDGSNSMEWEFKISLILWQKDFSYVLKKNISTLGDNATQDEKAAKEKFRKNEFVV